MRSLVVLYKEFIQLSGPIVPLNQSSLRRVLLEGVRINYGKKISDVTSDHWT